MLTSAKVSSERSSIASKKNTSMKEQRSSNREKSATTSSSSNLAPSLSRSTPQKARKRSRAKPLVSSLAKKPCSPKTKDLLMFMLSVDQFFAWLLTESPSRTSSAHLTIWRLTTKSWKTPAPSVSFQSSSRTLPSRMSTLSNLLEQVVSVSSNLSSIYFEFVLLLCLGEICVVF